MFEAARRTAVAARALEIKVLADVWRAGRATAALAAALAAAFAVTPLRPLAATGATTAGTLLEPTLFEVLSMRLELLDPTLGRGELVAALLRLERRGVLQLLGQLLAARLPRFSSVQFSRGRQ